LTGGWVGLRTGIDWLYAIGGTLEGGWVGLRTGVDWLYAIGGTLDRRVSRPENWCRLVICHRRYPWQEGG
jgi:hypothetical protein